MHASATAHPVAPPTPSMHPIASRMLDIILANAVDAQPSMEGDFAEFSKEDIVRHFPVAKSHANRQVVRQLDDERGFETHAQLIERCALSLMRTLPNEAEMQLTLRREGLGNAEIAQLWPELIAVTADAFAAARAALPAEV